MKKLPIGIQTFSEMIEDNYLYVDKTLLIDELIQSGKYLFLSRPRRFGKSLLVSTLKEIFSGNKELFRGLAIEQKRQWEPHPVIVIDFSIISYDNEKVFTLSLSSFLDDAASEYDLVLSKPFIKDKFAELIKKIHKKTRQKVVILVDEYDKPIIDHIDTLERAKKNREILGDFYGVLKYSDPYLRFAFLTGVSKFSRVPLFSGLNNLQDMTLSPQFAQLLGYTQEELEHYFSDYIENYRDNNHVSKQDILLNIKKWYNGYSWNGSDKVYNPFSILNFFNQRRFSNYWFATGTPAFLIKHIKNTQIEISEIDNKAISEIVFESYDIDNINIFSLLVQTGYLTIAGIERKERFIQYLLQYPNLEVKEAFLTFVFESFTHNRLDEIQPCTLKLYECLERDDIDGFINIIRLLFAKIPYTLHIQKKAYYHSLFYMMLTLIGFEIDVEVLTDKGRIDGVLKFDSKIYVIEFKYGPLGSDMNTLTEQAVRQIQEKNYEERFLNDHRSHVFFGVGFRDKEVGYKVVKGS
jgi:hypothetical protein